MRILGHRTTKSSALGTPSPAWLANAASEPARIGEGLICARFIYIDIFSLCNLRCPSCVVGDRNREGRPTARGMVMPAMLGRILDKAVGNFQQLGSGSSTGLSPYCTPGSPRWRTGCSLATRPTGATIIPTLGFPSLQL